MTSNFLFILRTLSTHTIVCVTIHSTRALCDTSVVNGRVEFSIRTRSYMSSNMEKGIAIYLVNWKLACNICMYLKCSWIQYMQYNSDYDCTNSLPLFWAWLTQIAQAVRHSSRPRHLHSMVSQRVTFACLSMKVSFTCSYAVHEN